MTGALEVANLLPKKTFSCECPDERMREERRAVSWGVGCTVNSGRREKCRSDLDLKVIWG